MNTEQIKARIYDMLVLIEQTKEEINKLQIELEKLNKEEVKINQEEI